MTQIREDTNKDGKSDIWELYDDAEALIRREQDLYYDGTPDIVEEKEKEIAPVDQMPALPENEEPPVTEGNRK